MPNTQERHTFALYYPALPSDFTQGALITVDDAKLVMRIAKVLRLKRDEQLILFSATHHAWVVIEQINRATVAARVKNMYVTRPFLPRITFLLPVLKRDALSNAVYQLVEGGANEVQLVKSEKMLRKWGGQKELERLRRVVIAAAEQAKYFALPTIREPILLENALEALRDGTIRFYGEPAGNKLGEVLCEGKNKKADTVLAIGPEGDFSAREKQRLHEYSFRPVCLGSTVLRAEAAVFYFTLSFRSVFYWS